MSFSISKPKAIIPFGLALACFKLAVRLIDDVEAALTAHNPIFPVTTPQRFQRISNFHNAESIRFLFIQPILKSGHVYLTHGGRNWD